MQPSRLSVCPCMYMHDTTVVCIWNDGICWTNVCGMETWYWNWTIHAEPSRALFGYPVGVRRRLRLCWESFAGRRHPQSGQLRWASPAGVPSPPALGGHLGWPSVAGGNAHHRHYALNNGTTVTSTRWTSLRPRSERPTTPQHTAHAACIPRGQALPRRWTSKPTAAGPPL